MTTLSLADAKAGYTQQQPGAAARKSDKEKTIFEFLSGDPKIEKAITAVAASHFTLGRFLRLAVNAVKKTPLLLMCDTKSVLGAFMTSAALGLEPNTVLQQAFLIPYKKRIEVNGQWVDSYECNFQVGARGFVTLAHRSPQIATLQSEAIHENDFFEHMLGTETFLKYRKALKERGDLIGSFCFTKLADGNEMATVLPVDEIHKIRARSDSYTSLVRGLADAATAKDKAKAQKKLDETPWVMWADDMASKSATKKHAKQLPLAPGDAMAIAAQIDSDDGRTIDMASMVDPDRVNAIMREGVDAHETGGSSSTEAFGVRNTSLATESDSADLQRSNAADAAMTHHAPAAHQPAQTIANTDQNSTFNTLKHSLATAADRDMLDAHADLIGNAAASEQEAEELRTIYRERHNALTTLPPPTPIKTRPRGGMSIS